MERLQLKIITILTIILSGALGIVSYFGLFVAKTYERDVLSMAAQGIGQDGVNLFFVVPSLLISLVLVRRKKKAAFFVFSGILFYILYSFFIYCFGVHFNNLFLLYCLVLGLSFYTFVLILCQLNQMNVQNWFSDRVPSRTIAIYFVFIALMFYLLWLKDILPAIFSNSVPSGVSDYGLLVNPVHVLDIAFALPALIITAILLLRKRPLGLILSSVFLVFVIILAVALIGMSIALKIKGINEDIFIAIIFGALAILGTGILVSFLKAIKTNQLA